MHRPPFKVLKQKAILRKKVNPYLEKVLKLLARPEMSIMKDVLQLLLGMRQIAESSNSVQS